jgi:hypothetical protein
VMAAAQPGEILVSRTVRDLAAGAVVTLEDRGRYLLKGVDGKGVDGDWQLHAVAQPCPRPWHRPETRAPVRPGSPVWRWPTRG